MNQHTIAYNLLRLKISVTRNGWASNCAFLLCFIGSIAYFFGLPQLLKNISVERNNIAIAQGISSSTPKSTLPLSIEQDEQNLREFFDALGEKNYPEQQIKTLIGIASTNGLALNQAEYKSAYDKNGVFHTYQIILPLKGSYASIRLFAAQALVKIPFASLDEIHFKREAISSPLIEAKLHFTLYLKQSHPVLKSVDAAPEQRRPQ